MEQVMEQEKTILVVEDEEALQEAIQTKLKKQGKYRVLSALSAEEALGVLVKDTPDLVWLDLLLPGMGGFQFLSNLRSTPQWRNLPVVIVSVSGTPEKIQRAFELNVIDYIVKSQYKLEDIIRRVGDVITGLGSEK
ncbi:MAG: response regulator [Patescibacteria group bacterium]